ncbi:hypothetical protein ARMGADRAFT_905414, partial [Armillaria gallica]
WKKCYSTLIEYDSKVVSSWIEEMNTTLIFMSASILNTASAGLYSAVVTAFLVELYKQLSADPVE